MAAQIVDTGSGPEQATLAGAGRRRVCLGRVGRGDSAGSKAPLDACPSEALVPSDAAALRALVGSLGARGVRRMTLITDTTPRGAAAEREVRTAARAALIAVSESLPADGKPEALLAIAGWQISELRLAQFGTGSPPLYGTYLAPWLVQAAMVAATGTSPLSVLPFDPTAPEARAYLVALRQVGPTESASTSGYRAFLAALGRPLPPHDLLLYASTVSFEVMPMGSSSTGGAMSMDHGGLDLTWFAGGALTPVSKPLTGPA